jgi:signal transduction histidine kinase
MRPLGSEREFEIALDRDWRITDITESAAAWAGSTVADLIGADGRKVNPFAAEVLADGVEAAFAQGQTTTFERPSTHVHGRLVRIEIRPQADRAVVRFVDITPELLREAHPEPLEFVDDGVPLSVSRSEIALLDGRGVIVATNADWRAGATALGYQQEEVGAGARYVAVAKAAVPETDEIGFQRQLDELFSGRIPELEATYTLPTPHGPERRQVRISPIRLRDETYFLAIHEDLTERARVLAALNETSDELLVAQERERQRIAIELHDSTSQSLVALLMGLGQMRRRVGGDMVSQVDELTALAKNAIEQTRTLSYLMNASGLPPKSLETSVRTFVDGFARRAGLKSTFEAEGPVDAVNAAVQHAVFRVVQEAASNVYRHAHATKIAVSLRSRGQTFTARIADDGIGMPASREGQSEHPSLGVGIPGMRARIEQLGGQLSFDRDGRGTAVTATIPLRAR